MYWDAEGDPIRLDPQSLKALNPGDLIHFDASKRELVLQAAPNANGLRQFSVAMTDGKLASTPQTLALNLRPVNDAPVVNAVGFQMLEDGGETDPTKSAWTYVSHELLLSGASDADGDVLKIVAVANARTTGVAKPEAVEVVNDPANGRIGLRAPLNYVGAIELDFTVWDGQSNRIVQKAYGSIAPVNDAPHLTVQQIKTVQKLTMTSMTPTEVVSWQLDAWDPDQTDPIKLDIQRNPLHGSVQLTKPKNSSDPRGGVSATATVTVTSGSGTQSSKETVWFSATDKAGASSQIDLSFTARYSHDPVVIDFGRDGLSFIEIDKSAARFNVDGVARRSAWIGAGEGILAYDVDGDGRIQRLDEIAFGSYIGQPTISDLQALQNLAFDRNQDAVFDAQDPAWQKFVVWRDLNGNGVSDTGELQSLNEAGIRALYLNANVLNRAEGPDVRVRGYTRVLMHDGRLLQAADVWLGLESTESGAATAGAALPATSTMQQATQLGADQLANLLKQIADAPREGNRAPMVYGYLPTQFADAGQPFRLELAPNFFIDLDTLDPVKIAARLANGSALPAWLRWDPVRLRLEGLPGAADSGDLELAFIATDSHGASTQTSFTLVIDGAASSAIPTHPDAAMPVDSSLQPIDLALSRLLSAVATGMADTSAAGSFDVPPGTAPAGGIDLLSGFRAAASTEPIPGFEPAPLAAADSYAAWNAAMAGSALPPWATPNAAQPWPSTTAPSAIA
jgi:hypothetical protein